MTIPSKRTLAILLASVTAVALAPAALAATIVPLGKASIIKAGRVIGEFDQEGPLPEGLTIRCDAGCVIQLEDVAIEVDPATSFSVSPMEKHHDLVVESGTVTFFLSPSSRPVHIDTPMEKAAIGHLYMNADELKGYVRAAADATEIGVLRGGTMVLDIGPEKMVVFSGEKLSIAAGGPGKPSAEITTDASIDTGTNYTIRTIDDFDDAVRGYFSAVSDAGGRSESGRSGSGGSSGGGAGGGTDGGASGGGGSGNGGAGGGSDSGDSGEGGPDSGDSGGADSGNGGSGGGSSSDGGSGGGGPDSGGSGGSDSGNGGSGDGDSSGGGSDNGGSGGGDTGDDGSSGSGSGDGDQGGGDQGDNGSDKGGKGGDKGDKGGDKGGGKGGDKGGKGGDSGGGSGGGNGGGAGNGK